MKKLSFLMITITTILPMQLQSAAIPTARVAPSVGRRFMPQHTAQFAAENPELISRRIVRPTNPVAPKAEQSFFSRFKESLTAPKTPSLMWQGKRIQYLPPERYSAIGRGTQDFSTLTNSRPFELYLQMEEHPLMTKWVKPYKAMHYERDYRKKLKKWYHGEPKKEELEEVRYNPQEQFAPNAQADSADIAAREAYEKYKQNVLEYARAQHLLEQHQELKRQIEQARRVVSTPEGL